MISVAEPWVEAPLKRFVDDARVTFALLIYPSGQVLGQSGFARAVDVMSAAALAAGIYATVRELGRTLDGKGFRDVFHAGAKRRLYLAEATSPRGPCLFLTVFDDQSSLGLVQLYFEELRTAPLLIGPAEVCAERLAAFVAAGARRIFVWPLGDEVTQLELFRERVTSL